MLERQLYSTGLKYVVSTCSIRRICAFTALSTNIWCFQIGEVVTTIPTIGFNVESVTYRNLNLNVWVGGFFFRGYSRVEPLLTAVVIGSRRSNIHSSLLAVLLRKHRCRCFRHRFHRY